MRLNCEGVWVEGNVFVVREEHFLLYIYWFVERIFYGDDFRDCFAHNRGHFYFLLRVWRRDVEILQNNLFIINIISSYNAEKFVFVCFLVREVDADLSSCLLESEQREFVVLG